MRGPCNGPITAVVALFISPADSLNAYTVSPGDARAIRPRPTVDPTLDLSPSLSTHRLAPALRRLARRRPGPHMDRGVVVRRLARTSAKPTVGPATLVSETREARHPAFAVTDRGLVVAWTDGSPAERTTIGVRRVGQ